MITKLQDRLRKVGVVFENPFGGKVLKNGLQMQIDWENPNEIAQFGVVLKRQQSPDFSLLNVDKMPSGEVANMTAARLRQRIIRQFQDNEIAFAQIKITLGGLDVDADVPLGLLETDGGLTFKDLEVTIVSAPDQAS